MAQPVCGLKFEAAAFYEVISRLLSLLTVICAEFSQKWHQFSRSPGLIKAELRITGPAETSLFLPACLLALHSRQPEDEIISHLISN